ncbi:hypothetical protein KR074_007654, partial [Drosophila pseudoananassae]
EKSNLDARLERIEFFAGKKETLVIFNLKVIGREHFLNGTIKTLIDFDRSIHVHGDIWSFKNGEWAKSNLNFHLSGCGFLDVFYTRFLKDAFKESNTPKPACPLPKGEYHIRRAKLNAESWPSYMSAGLTKIRYTFEKDEEMVGGIQFIINVKEENI